MARPAGIPSRFVRAEIEEALGHGATLRTIEREIVDCAPVSEDARAALWLFAWGASERRARGAPAPLLAGGPVRPPAQRC